MTPPRPFPTSLCHACAAPIRYVVTDKGSTFMQCPVLKRYPPQPVISCASFVALRAREDRERDAKEESSRSRE